MTGFESIGGGYCVPTANALVIKRRNVAEAARLLQTLMDTISQSRSALEEALRLAESLDVNETLHQHGMQELTTEHLMTDVYSLLLEARVATRKVLAKIAPENDTLLMHLHDLHQDAKEDKS